LNLTLTDKLDYSKQVRSGNPLPLVLPRGIVHLDFRATILVIVMPVLPSSAALQLLATLFPK
jgi:hypothetical protein